MDAARRSAASAVRFECRLRSFLIDGVGCEDQEDDCLGYRLVDSLSSVEDSTELVELLYETHPLACPSYGERLVLTARPLQLVYHAQTIARVVDILAPPQTLSVQQ